MRACLVFSLNLSTKIINFFALGTAEYSILLSSDMDFLDPAKKRAHAIRLAIGQTLIGLAIVIGTFILVYQAYGFDVDRKTGEVFQNGLVFIDSAPDGAEIKLNGTVHREQTNTRVALPEGKYDLEINKQGYRTWKKTFNLEGGFIERFAYPTLFLNDLAPSQLQAFDKPVNFMTQSPDRRWVLIGEQNGLASLTEYDLNSLEQEKPINQTINLPDNLFTPATGNHTLKLVEWSNDNKNLLVRHGYKGGNEFVMINRDKPAESFNVNRTFNQNPSQVALRDKKVDELYLFEAKTGALSRRNVETGQSAAVASGVLSFAPHGKNVLALAVVSAENPKKIQYSIKDEDETYVVREAEKSQSADVEIAQYDGDWYFVAHDPLEKKTYIYRNPADFIKNQVGLKPAPVMVMRSSGAIDDLTFSQNTQFIAVRNDQDFSVYDNEYARTYKFQVKDKFDKNSEVEWMDGHRFLTQSGGKIILFEFDGQNQQSLVGGQPGLPAIFNRDYTALYSLSPSGKQKLPAFFQTFLRLEEDR